MTRQRLAVLSWKIGLICIAVVLTVLDLWAANYWQRSLDPAIAGTLDASLRRQSRSRFDVTALGPRSPLASAGVKVGDTLEFDRPGDRSRDYGIDELIGVRWYSGDGARQLEVRPVSKGSIDFASRFGYWSTAAKAPLALAIALLIGLRRAESPAMRWLALLVSLSVLDFAIDYLPSSGVLDFLVRIYRACPWLVAYVSFVGFALRFPEEHALWRLRAVRVGARLYLLVMLVSASAAVAGNFGAWTRDPLPAERVLAQGLALVSVAIGLGALSFSWLRSNGAARNRVRWIILCTGGSFVLAFANNLFGLFGLDMPWGNSAWPIVQLLSFCGLGYAILRHRVLDFGFAVNRALVYSIVSFVLLAAFFGIKGLAEKVLRLEGPNSSALLNGAIALAIFVVFHRVHDFVEHQVERWLFHQWHLSELALKHFLKEAAHISRSESLLLAFAAAIDRFTDRAGNAIYRIADDGWFACEQSTLGDAPLRIDVDDPLVVTMKTEREPVACVDTASTLPAALGLPMTHRGELNGFVLVGSKSQGEHYRPDQVELLGLAAQQVGLDLYALQVARLKSELSALAADRRSFSELEREVRASMERSLLPRPATSAPS